MIRINLLKEEKIGLDTKALLVRIKQVDIKTILSSDLVLIVVPIIGAIVIGAELVIYANLSKGISRLEKEIQDLNLRKTALVKEVTPIKVRERELRRRIGVLKRQIAQLDKKLKIYKEIVGGYSKFLESFSTLESLQTTDVKITELNHSMTLNVMSFKINVSARRKEDLEAFLKSVHEHFVVSKPIISHDVNGRSSTRRKSAIIIVEMKENFDLLGNKIFNLSMVLNKNLDAKGGI